MGSDPSQSPFHKKEPITIGNTAFLIALFALFMACCILGLIFIPFLQYIGVQ